VGNPGMTDRYSTEERIKIACWFEETGSCKEVRDRFRIHFGKDPPSHLTIRRTVLKFKTTGAVTDNLKGTVGRKRCVIIHKLQKIQKLTQFFY
jgi:hypothetical protein